MRLFFFIQYNNLKPRKSLFISVMGWTLKENVMDIRTLTLAVSEFSL